MTDQGDRPDVLDLRVREHDDRRVTVTAAGELDFGTHQPLLDLLTDRIAHGRRRIVLDLAGVTFCDSTGLGVLVQGWQQATDDGGWLRVVAPSDAVSRALEITNLDRLIPTFATERDALSGD